MSSAGHRPGVFKQPAKTHKTGRHRSKGQIDKESRGRLAVRDSSRARNRSLSKAQRREQADHIRLNKRKAAFDEKRALSGAAAPPALTTILALGEANAAEFLNRLGECDETIERGEGHNVSYFSVPRFKSRIGFLAPNMSKLDDVLDALKVSDVMCVVWPLSGELSEWEELLLSAILAHGMPTVLNIVPGLAGITNTKQREAARKNVEKLVDKWSLSTEKLQSADSVSDGLLIVRNIIHMKKKKMLMQKRRAHLLVERLGIEDEKDGVCTLLASGYVRGPAWDVNRIVHIPAWGDFQVSKITAHDDPHPLKKGPMSEGDRVIATADPEKQESLQSEIVPDPLDGEQTWPDEYDGKGEEELRKELVKKRVPKGTSSYQAAWIEEEDDDEEGGDEGEDDDEDLSGSDEEDENMEADMMEEDDDQDGAGLAMDDAATEVADGEEDEDEDIDMGEVEKYRLERENAQFPDETDTPIDTPARIRFQKYRGLQSFRTSPWDAMENLPYDYARIFKFANFKRTKKAILQGEVAEEDGVTASSGVYVTLHIANVPSSFAAEVDQSAPLVLYSLLPHEQKMSVLNMVIKKHASCTVPIPNKSKLVFHIGFRKFEAEPIFSQHTNGDKFKMERFLRADGATVASIFAPITFPPSAVLVFRVDAHGRQELVASGSILDNNPDRIVLKRIVLSGHPFKINKRSVVARYMFFNREDIEWFKPVELCTPRGRRGHITEALGTHGHMKCRFDQQLNAQDSVMMSLYKRVFPKWTYSSRVTRAQPSRHAPDADME